MRIYELVLIVRSSLSEAQRKKLLETVKGFLKSLKITKEDSLGEKALAYTIKRENSGYYYMLAVEGDSIPLDFEKKLFEQEDVIRHLLIRKK